MSNALDSVHSAADSIGVIVKAFTMDGKWHRVPAYNGQQKRKPKNGAYCLSELRLSSGTVAIVGKLMNWATGADATLTLEDIEGVTDEDIKEARRLAAEAAERSKREKAALQEETAERAARTWQHLPDTGRSPYLTTKRVKAWGLRFAKSDAIVVPVRDINGKLWSLQFIQANGDKRFLTGGAKQGRFHLIGRLPDKGQAFTLGVAEGYATAASIYQAIKTPIATAFDAGNILPVCEAFKGVYPNIKIVIFADDDRFNGYPQAFIRVSECSSAVQRVIGSVRARRPDVVVEVVPDDDSRLRDRTKSFNVGVTKAILAAAAVGGAVVLPRFANEREV